MFLQVELRNMETYSFQPKPVAPSIDDIVKALNNKTLVAGENSCKALSTVTKHPIEQFNFGPLKLDTIREMAKEAIEFVEYGCFTFPYPVCLYRVSVQYNNAIVGMTILVVDGRAGQPEIYADGREGVATLSMVHSHSEMCAMHVINMLNVKDDPQGRGKAVELHIPASELSFWKDKITIGGPEGFTEQNTENITEGAMVAMALTMILNTKGIRKERSEPPHKPNEARARAGKPLLPYVTRVYTDVYNRAVEAGEPGTHASPRPHRRRAHVRHMPARGEHEAYRIPIEAMLVNWDGKPLAPHQYEVPRRV
jgi:hypothetical protein